MPYQLPERCTVGIDSLSTIASRARGKEREDPFVEEYETLLSNYKLLCAGCNVVDSRLRDDVWLSRIRDFIGHVRSYVVPLMDDEEYRHSVRRMFCNRIRCDNLPNWPENLNRDFFNWICHKTAFVGYALLGMEHFDTNQMGAPGSQEMEENAFYLVNQFCEVSPRRGLYARVKRAQKAFYVAHLARDTRHSADQTISICGEVANGAHAYQRELMRALRKATQLWLQENRN